ncbi:phosphatidylinositol 3-and 4-kinase family protein [Babesia divergens]|uniref:Serine/threonine-protein kinase ATR n=1 Tax=Babesia divergens TaxID=32595 RepID=A0AAD9GF95_BABDI|nr:phosphatidylinositol 3-and 4-kinase family protein [Babesia divergens]
MRSLQMVSTGIEIKSPAVTSSANTLLILSVLISEIIYNSRVVKSVEVDPRSWEITTDHTSFTTALATQSGYPIMRLTHNAATCMLDHSLRPVAPVVATEQGLTYNIAVWHAYAYLMHGYCNFRYKGNFVLRLLGDRGDGGHNRNALMDLAGRLDKCTFSSTPMGICHTSATVLRSMRLMQEVVLQLTYDIAQTEINCTTPHSSKLTEACHNTDTLNDMRKLEYLKLTIRALFVCHLHYFKTKILRVGIHTHDMDYYSTFFKMAAVMLHKFKCHISDETADILMSIMILSLKVVRRTKDHDRLVKALPCALLTTAGNRPTGVTNADPIDSATAAARRRSSDRFQDCMNIVNTKAAVTPTSKRDTVLRVAPFAYANTKELVQRYVAWTQRPYDILKAIYSQLNDAGLQPGSLLALASNELNSLLRNYEQFSDLRKAEVDAIRSSMQSSEGTEQPAVTPPNNCKRPQPMHYGFSKCLKVTCDDEKTAAATCIAAEAAIRCLQNHARMDKKAIALSFIFLNSVAFLLLGIPKLLMRDGGTDNCGRKVHTISLVIETYLHIQSMGIKTEMGTTIRASLTSIMAVCDAIVELLTYSLLKTEVKTVLASANLTSRPRNVPTPSKWVLMMSCMRCITASPIKDILHVINTLCYMVTYNAETYRRLLSQTSSEGISPTHDVVMEWFWRNAQGFEPRENEQLTESLHISLDNAMTAEKLVIHAVTRYLSSVAINLKLLTPSDDSSSRLDDAYIDEIFNSIFRLVQRTVFADPIYNVTTLVPFVLTLSQLLGATQGDASNNLIKYCIDTHNINRRRHAVAHTIPFLCDPKRLLTSRKGPVNRRDTDNPSGTNNTSQTPSKKPKSQSEFNSTSANATSSGFQQMDNYRELVPYVRRIKLSATRLPMFCFYCRRKFKSNMQEGYFYVTCEYCLHPSPLKCEGEIDVNNCSNEAYLTTLVRLTTRRVAEGNMLSLAANSPAGSKGVGLNWDPIISLIANTTQQVIHQKWKPDLLMSFSMDLSNVLAFYLQCVSQAADPVLDVVSRLRWIGNACSLWIMDKGMAYLKLRNIPGADYHVQFFKARFDDNMILMSDSSTDLDHMRLHYFYDCLLMSLGAATSQPSEEDECMDFWHGNPSLASNLSVTTLSQIVNYLIQQVIDAETHETEQISLDSCGGVVDHHNKDITKALFGLSQISNVLSIPLPKLLVSGLSLTLVRTLLNARANLPAKQLMMPAEVIERVEDLHERMMRSIICCDAMLRFTVENCDYRLFQIMQAFNAGAQIQQSTDQLRKLDKFRFYAMVRLLWYVTNPHVALKMDVRKGSQHLLAAQAAYVASPFTWYLETMRKCKRNQQSKGVSKVQNTTPQTQITAMRIDSPAAGTSCAISTPDLDAAKATRANTMCPQMQVAAQTVTQHSEYMQVDEESSMQPVQSALETSNEIDVMIEYFQENFVRILEYFVAVWLKRGQQNLNFALKNKRVFYPEIYGYNETQHIRREHIVRTYNCIAILMWIYRGDIDVFCDRMIEVLTLSPIDTYNSWMLLNCWAAMANRMSATSLGWYAPGIAYYVAKIGGLQGDSDECRESSPAQENLRNTSLHATTVITDIKAALKETGYGERFWPFIDCIVECVNHPRDLTIIHIKLGLLATMVHSDDQIKVPYITREAAALTANQLLEHNPFIFNMVHAKEAAAKLAMSSLLTIAAYSDDFAKDPTTLATACCSILGYIPCDLIAFHAPKEQCGMDLQCSSDDPRDLATLVLRGYLIPNMHMQVALYCIQEILKLLNLYKGGLHSPQELVEMGERWNQTFEPVIRRAIEPYRATSFLRNRAIEDVIETRLDVNTVLDIKSFVWWLLKMLPPSCPMLTLFRACDLAMVKIPSVLSFLLPYIVDSCVQFLDNAQCLTIGKRMASLLCNILKRDSSTFGINWQPPYEVLSKSGRSLETTDQYTSCQAIFNLLDNIKILIDRYRKALNHALDSANNTPKQEASKETGQNDAVKSGVQMETGAEDSSLAVQKTDKNQDVNNEQENIVKVLKTKIKRLQSILFAVPQLLVAHAAISCGSYARGVMIIEKKLTYGPNSYNFDDPGYALSNRALRENVVDHGGLRPQAIISLLCRGYCGLADFDSLVCISNIVLNDESLHSDRDNISACTASNSDTIMGNTDSDAASRDSNKARVIETPVSVISKRQRDVCRAFSYECRGKYRLACDVYNKLLKNSHDSRLWASWYRIIQMTGPSVFIRLPQPPEVKESFDSLMAESITACWKLALWDELDELLEKKHTRDRELLDLQTDEFSAFDLTMVDRSADYAGAPESQWTQCTANGKQESDVFWESLLMRDPIDVWFMEQTAEAMSHLQKNNYSKSEQTVHEGFKHLIRPLGLAIRESTLVAVKYLEKIASFNALRLVNRFNSGKYGQEERRFARELISLVNSSAMHGTRSVVNILGTAKVALELGSKIHAAAELLISLNQACRTNGIDIHIPGNLSLDDEILSGRNDVVLENALTLHHKGNVDDAISTLNLLARHDFEGFYNLVKIYSESNLLIPKRAVSYMREILHVAPQSFKANLLHAEYLDRLLEHRLRNAQNIRLVLDDNSICSRKSVHKSSVEATYKITGVDGIPGMYSFVQLVAATVNAYLQTLSLVGATRSCSNGSIRDHSVQVTESSTEQESRQPSSGMTVERSYEVDEHVVTMSSPRDGICNNSTTSDTSAEESQDAGGSMDIVDILTKVIAIVCFYCTPNTTQFSSSVTFENEACQIFSHAIMERFFEYNDTVPQFYWYAVISQIMSRCHHKVLGACLFQTLVARLVARYPKQALWSTLYFAYSVNSRMRQIHVNIERKAREISQSTMLIVEYYHSIFKEMNKVAMDTTVSITDKSATRFQGLWRVLNSPGCKEYVIIPTMQNLSFEHIINYDLKETESRMCGMDEHMQVLRSKQKPKKVGFMTRSGRIVHFLVKNEVKGDLRKDKRMMEVTQYLAMLLRKHYNGMPLQCYSVVSLTEVAGIIEWVPNMATMRALVTDELRRVREGYDRDSKPYITKYAACVTAKKFGESLALFRTLCERRPPVLHRAYYSVFKRDPAAWFGARKEFIHTCAVWSILGYIVGLGDRHAENILLNLITGQIMHVDFDCLFGKGIQLAIPELVPFRMTQNVVCNLGVCGTATDGPFYSEALKFLQMLHQNRQKITAILMSFVFDPLIEWNRGEGIPNADTDSQKVVQCIENKLRGALNVVIPSVEIESRLLSGGQPEDAADLHAFKTFENVAEIMEPRQQLQQLIQVATSHAHLSKMFVGWAPWM